VNKVQSDATTVSTDAATVAAASGSAATYATGASTLLGSVTSSLSSTALTQGIDTLAAGASRLSTGATALKSQLDAGGTLNTSLKQLGSGAENLYDALAVGDSATQTPSAVAGAKALSDGVTRAAAGANAAYQGVSTPYADESGTGGAKALAWALSASNTSGLTYGAHALVTGLNGDGTASNPGAVAGAANLVAAIGDASNLTYGSGYSLYGGTAALSTGLSAADSGAKTLDAGLSQLSTGAATLSSGISSASAGSSTLTTGLTQLTAGSQTLTTGLETAESGGATLASGLSTLSDGTSSAYEGSQTLTAGLDELRDSVSGLDEKVLDELQDTIDEKLGKGYQLHSFVEPTNTDVDEVEFVYVVSGVSNDDDSDETSTTTSDETSQASDTTSDDSDSQDGNFLTRLAALYSKKDDSED